MDLEYSKSEIKFLKSAGLKLIKFPAHVMLFAKDMRCSSKTWGYFVQHFQIQPMFPLVCLSNTFEFNLLFRTGLFLVFPTLSNLTYFFALGYLCLYLFIQSLWGFNLLFRTRLSHSFNVFSLKIQISEQNTCLFIFALFSILKNGKEGQL